MKAPGVYIKVTKNNDSSISVMVPYTDQFGFSCTQKYFKPLEELFSAIGGIVQQTVGEIGGIGGAIGVGAIEAAKQGLRLFGVKLFNKAFMAKAWEGEEPVDISINLKFFFGMDGTWSGLKEVYQPIMKIMAETVPADKDSKGILLTAPGPRAIDVFTYFGKYIFDGLSKAIKDTLQPQTEELSKDVETESLAATSLKTNIIKNTWSLSIGYSSNGETINKSFFILSNLVVTNSTFAFSPEVDTDGAPINGTLKLSFTAQELIVKSDFETPKLTKNTPVFIVPTYRKGDIKD